MLSWSRTSGSLVRAALKFLSFIAIPILAFAGDDFWNQKDFSQWSQKETKKLLEDSPWSKQYSIVNTPQIERSEAIIVPLTNFTQTYTVQLRSAKPIQQAMVRQIQLSHKYDNSSSDMSAIETTHDVIVHIAFLCNTPDDLISYWQAQTTDTLKDSVFLVVGKRVKIPIKRFVLENEFPQLEREMIPENKMGLIEFEFIFPRRLKDREILVAGDKILKLEFTYPFTGGKFVTEPPIEKPPIEKHVTVEFNTDKMKFQGKLSY